MQGSTDIAYRSTAKGARFAHRLQLMRFYSPNWLRQESQLRLCLRKMRLNTSTEGPKTNFKTRLWVAAQNKRLLHAAELLSKPLQLLAQGPQGPRHPKTSPAEATQRPLPPRPPAPLLQGRRLWQPGNVHCAQNPCLVSATRTIAMTTHALSLPSSWDAARTSKLPTSACSRSFLYHSCLVGALRLRCVQSPFAMMCHSTSS